AHVNAPVPSVCDRLETLPCELDPVLDRALAKDPRERYSTCAEFVAALRAAVSEAAGKTSELAAVAPAAAPKVDTGTPARSRLGRPSTRGAALVALLIAAAVAGGIIATVLGTGGGGKPAATKPHAKKATPKKHSPATTPATPSRSTPTTPSTPVSGDGVTLNNNGYALMQGGDYSGALPLLESAVQ